KNYPLCWLVIDERTLGSFGFAKSLRKYLAEHPNNHSIGVVESPTSIPVKISGITVIVAGSPDGWNQAEMGRLASMASRMILLSPSYYPHEIGNVSEMASSIDVYFGEFSQSSCLSAWEETGKVQRLAGVGDFFPNWPQIAFGEKP
ncbi:MAG: hypothetical protein WCP55_17700, partial [Lentisphaerota bacterium]